jgi:hypothetical protein
LHQWSPDIGHLLRNAQAPLMIETETGIPFSFLGSNMDEINCGFTTETYCVIIIMPLPYFSIPLSSSL